MARIIGFQFLTLIIFLSGSLAILEGETEAQILDRIFKNYTNNVRPSTKGPTTVLVNVYLRSLNCIDDHKMEYTVQVTLRQEWRDDRLKFRRSNDLLKGYLSLPNVNLLWVPDLFFRNERKGEIHSIIRPNVFARIFPDGNILYSTRVTLTLSCPMNLKKYPFDSPNCTMQMASYGMATEDLIYRWKTGEPVQLSPSLQLSGFSLKDHETGTCDTKTNTGLYSCLKIDFLFKREFSHYLIQIYIPSTNLVIVAWLSFWLDSTNVQPRILLATVTHLIAMIGTGLLNQKIPKTSYTKAVDVWTGICLTFIFSALCETIVVSFWSRQRQRGLEKRESVGGISITVGKDEGRHVHFKKKSWSNKLDIIFRILYPIFFVLFVAVYFYAFLK